MANSSHNGNWNASGRTVTTHGYVRLRVGVGHPLADSKGWAYAHLVTWHAAGRTVPSGHEVHHRNEDKTDNRLSNLVLKSKSQHASHHARGRRRTNGRFAKETA